MVGQQTSYFQSSGWSFRASSLALGLGAPPSDDSGRALFNASLSARVRVRRFGLPMVEFQSRGFAFRRSWRVWYDGSCIFRAFSASEPRSIEVVASPEAACARLGRATTSGEKN